MPPTTTTESPTAAAAAQAKHGIKSNRKKKRSRVATIMPSITEQLLPHGNTEPRSASPRAKRQASPITCRHHNANKPYHGCKYHEQGTCRFHHPPATAHKSLQPTGHLATPLGHETPAGPASTQGVAMTASQKKKAKRRRRTEGLEKEASGRRQTEELGDNQESQRKANDTNDRRGPNEEDGKPSSGNDSEEKSTKPPNTGRFSPGTAYRFSKLIDAFVANDDRVQTRPSQTNRTLDYGAEPVITDNKKKYDKQLQDTWLGTKKRVAEGDSFTIWMETYKKTTDLHNTTVEERFKEEIFLASPAATAFDKIDNRRQDIMGWRAKEFRWMHGWNKHKRATNCPGQFFSETDGNASTPSPSDDSAFTGQASDLSKQARNKRRQEEREKRRLSKEADNRRTQELAEESRKLREALDNEIKAFKMADQLTPGLKDSSSSEITDSEDDITDTEKAEPKKDKMHGGHNQREQKPNKNDATPGNGREDDRSNSKTPSDKSKSKRRSTRNNRTSTNELTQTFGDWIAHVPAEMDIQGNTLFKRLSFLRAVSMKCTMNIPRVLQVIDHKGTADLKRSAEHTFQNREPTNTSWTKYLTEHIQGRCTKTTLEREIALWVDTPIGQKETFMTAAVKAQDLSRLARWLKQMNIKGTEAYKEDNHARKFLYRWPEAQRLIITTAANIDNDTEWTFVVVIKTITKCELEETSHDTLEADLASTLIRALDRAKPGARRLNNITFGDNTTIKTQDEDKDDTRATNKTDAIQLQQLQNQVADLRAMVKGTDVTREARAVARTELQQLEAGMLDRIDKYQRQQSRKATQNHSNNYQSPRQDNRNTKHDTRTSPSYHKNHSPGRQSPNSYRGNKSVPQKHIPCIDFFAKNNTCNKGDDCPKSHDTRDSRVCGRFRQGTCNRGSDCNFQHTEPREDNSNSKPNSSNEPKPQKDTCQQFLKGNCTYTTGNGTCRFNHPVEQAADIVCTKPGCRGKDEDCPHRHN